MAGRHRQVRDVGGQQPRPRCGAAGAAHPLHPGRGGDPAASGPAEPGLEAPVGRGRGPARRDRRLRLHPHPVAGQGPAAPTRTVSRPATTRRSSSSAGPAWSTTRRARSTSSPRSWPISSPKAVTPPLRSTSRPTVGCWPVSAGSGSRCCKVEAKFKYDDHNPVEHRERVVDRLHERGRGLDGGAATQQQRRLAAIGDWETHRKQT